MLKLFLLLLSHGLNFTPSFLRRSLAVSLGSLWFFVFPFRRRIVLDNLSIAFPNLSRSERFKLAYRNYLHYSRTILEILQAMT